MVPSVKKGGLSLVDCHFGSFIALIRQTLSILRFGKNSQDGQPIELFEVLGRRPFCGNSLDFQNFRTADQLLIPTSDYKFRLRLTRALHWSCRIPSFLDVSLFLA